MKICPACQTQYTDDTLKFCLQDGTPLTFAGAADTPTAVLNETETIAARGARLQVPINDVRSGARPPSQVIAGHEKKETNIATAVILTAVGMLVLFGAVGIAAWMYFRNSQPLVVQNTVNNRNTPLGTVNSTIPTPKASRPTVTPIPTSNDVDALPPRIDDSQIQRDVMQRLDSWKSQAEALDVDAYMEHYAPVVDYYKKPGSSISYVRADKMRAFSRYDSIRVNLSNMSVTIDPSGGTATAVFDKEWNFQGNGSSSGKVRQMMRFRKINGQWLISAEKDMKLYYKR